MRQLTINFYSIVMLSVFLMGCQPEGRVFVEHKELSPMLEWLKKDVIEFEVAIENKADVYNMSLAFRYATGYEHESLRVKVIEKSPSGKLKAKEYELKLKDKKGNYIGDPALIFFDSEHLVETNFIFNETGTYVFSIEHLMDQDPVQNAMEIGFILDKVN